MTKTKFLIIALLSLTCRISKNNDDFNFSTLNGFYIDQKPPGKTPEVFAPGIISTSEFNDRDLTISPDGSQIFFSRTKTGNSNDYDYDIMYTKLN